MPLWGLRWLFQAQRPADLPPVRAAVRSATMSDTSGLITILLDGDRKPLVLRENTPEEAASRAEHRTHLLQLGQVTYHYIGNSPQGQRQYMRLR